MFHRKLTVLISMVLFTVDGVTSRENRSPVITFPTKLQSSSLLTFIFRRNTVEDLHRRKALIVCSELYVRNLLSTRLPTNYTKLYTILIILIYIII